MPGTSPQSHDAGGWGSSKMGTSSRPGTSGPQQNCAVLRHDDEACFKPQVGGTQIFQQTKHKGMHLLTSCEDEYNRIISWGAIGLFLVFYPKQGPSRWHILMTAKLHIKYPPLCPANNEILHKYGPNRSVRWTRRSVPHQFGT